LEPDKSFIKFITKLFEHPSLKQSMDDGYEIYKSYTYNNS